MMGVKEVEELIEKKKKEAIEQVKRDTKGLEEGIVNEAVHKLEGLAEEIKMAASVSIPDDILSIIEKNGIVWRGDIDTKELFSWTNMDRDQFLAHFNEFGNYLRQNVRTGGNFNTNILRVTLIVEPLEGK